MNARVLTCSCNGTVDVDGPALGRSLKAAGVPADVVMSGTQLCRRQLPEAAKWLEGVDDIVLACTQERALFDEAAHKAVAPIRFVNVREQAGWGSDAAGSQRGVDGYFGNPETIVPQGGVVWVFALP